MAEEKKPESKELSDDELHALVKEAVDWNDQDEEYYASSESYDDYYVSSEQTE